MEQVLQQLDQLRHLSLATATRWVDILIVTYLIYTLLVLIKGTRGWRLMFGLGSFVALLLISKFLQLDTVWWILDKATLLGPVALVILFLPELRQALESFGKFWPQSLGLSESRMEAHTIEEIVAAVAELSAARIGAIIVILREASLEQIIANGVALDAKVSAPLLGSIFYEGNPLHDGAAIVNHDQIVSAACRLPLSESTRLDSHVHMRHRAAVGVSETADCIAVVVSEERGTISIAVDGHLNKLPGPMELRESLGRYLRPEMKSRRERTRRLVRREEQSA